MTDESIKHHITKSVFIDASPEQVFTAVTTASDWDRYFTTGMELDPRPGGMCHFRWKDWGPFLIELESPGEVLEVVPNKRFVFRWGRPGRVTTARLDIDAKYGGSILSLDEDGYRDSDDGLAYMIESAAHWGELLVLIKFYVESGMTYKSPQAADNAHGS